MKTIIFLIGLITVVSCQTTKVAVSPSIKNYTAVVTPSNNKPIEYYDSIRIREEEKELYEFLKNQPKEVLEDFKRDFVLMPDQYVRFVDSLKTKLKGNLIVIEQ